MDTDPRQSRLFVVCGRAIEADALQEAFMPYGAVQNVKMVKDKGVAYVKFDRASSAALAIENLNGAVLNDGRGPKLKVMLAEAPTPRGMAPSVSTPEPEISSDPDNVPPRSRLFIVVPKQADAQQIRESMQIYRDLDFCKTDLISDKGVVFCKFFRASSALSAMEDITATGTLAGYKVKCMLAEPKTKRRTDGPQQDVMFRSMPQAKLGYDLADATAMQQLKLPPNLASSVGMADYAAISGLTSNLGSGLGGFTLSGMNNLADVSAQNSLVNSLGLVGLGRLQAGSPVSPNNDPGNSPRLSKQRLFVVVHKGVSEDMIARLFRKLPGMEYCDLKKDRMTGKSKGFAYVNYSTPEAAHAAIEQLNGIEFPPHSGQRIKVMYAEPLGVRPGSQQGASRNSPISVQTTSASLMQTPISHTLSPDVASMSDTLAGMSVQRVASQHAHLSDQVDLAARMISPASSAGALNNMTHASPVPAQELMFNVQ